MQLLLRRNYLVLIIDQNSEEWVQIQLRGKEIEHKPWKGFVDRLAHIEGRAAFIPCNGWRCSESQNWSYLSRGDYVAGVLTVDGIYAFQENSIPVLVKK